MAGKLSNIVSKQKEVDKLQHVYYNVLQREEVSDMSISLRINDQDADLIKNYAALHNISISDLFRQAVMEKIEDEYDLEAYEKAMEEYKKDDSTYTLGEVEEELGLM